MIFNLKLSPCNFIDFFGNEFSKLLACRPFAGRIRTDEDDFLQIGIFTFTGRFLFF